MTVGTGFTGRSSLGESWARAPRQLVPARLHQGRVGDFPDFAGSGPGTQPLAGRTSRSDVGGLSGATARSQASSASRSAGRDSGTARPHRSRLMAELRSFIFIDQLQPQTLCTLATWIRGSLPRAAHGRSDHRGRTRTRCRAAHGCRAQARRGPGGVLVVERQFGYLEIHGSPSAVRSAASAVLMELGAERARRAAAEGPGLEDRPQR